MTRTANSAMIPALKQMWFDCFGDNAAYVNFLFANLLRPERILVSLDAERRPVSMLCFQPFELRGSPTPAPGAYIYGVATDPGHRGQGLSTSLLNDAHRYLHGKGFALSCLVPASETLFDFYGQRGYHTQFFVRRARILGEQIPDALLASGALVSRSFEQLAVRRDNYFADSGLFVRWDPSYLRYIGDECRFLGGEALSVALDGTMGYAVCYRTTDKVYVKELAVPEPLLPQVMAVLHSRYHAREYILSLRADFSTPYSCDTLPFAMIKWYDESRAKDRIQPNARAPYIAHVLD